MTPRVKIPSTTTNHVAIMFIWQEWCSVIVLGFQHQYIGGTTMIRIHTKSSMLEACKACLCMVQDIETTWILSPPIGCLMPPLDQSQTLSGLRITAITLRFFCQVTVELKYFLDHPWSEESDTIFPTKLDPNRNHIGPLESSLKGELA